MYGKLLTLFLLALLYPCIQQAQNKKYEHDYDATGNRIAQRVVNMTKSSQKGQDSLNANEDVSGSEIYEETLGELEIKVYPNPTKGKLKVSISTPEEIHNSRLDLISPSGKTLFSRSGLGEEIEIDITGSPSGIYLMQIQINKTTSHWKIVKQ